MITAANAVNQIAAALAVNSSRIILDKASVGNQTVGRMCSLWRATGFPAQGAIPTAPAFCTNSLLGAIGFTQQTAPVESYIGQLALNAGNSAMSWEIHDRLAHMGGLLLNITTSQTVNLDLEAFVTALNISADRLGDPSYNDTQCWLEVYGDGGATASNATINVTFTNNTSANLNTQAVGGTIRAGNMFNLEALKTPAQQGLIIKRINTVILSASTGTAGNFGFTFTRPRAFAPTFISNVAETYDWAMLGIPVVPNESCLQFMTIPSTTSSGTLRGGGKIIHA